MDCLSLHICKTKTKTKNKWHEEKWSKTNGEKTLKKASLMSQTLWTWHRTLTIHSKHKPPTKVLRTTFHPQKLNSKPHAQKTFYKTPTKESVKGKTDSFWLLQPMNKTRHENYKCVTVPCHHEPVNVFCFSSYRICLDHILKFVTFFLQNHTGNLAKMPDVRCPACCVESPKVWIYAVILGRLEQHIICKWPL